MMRCRAVKNKGVEKVFFYHSNKWKMWGLLLALVAVGLVLWVLSRRLGCHQMGGAAGSGDRATAWLRAIGWTDPNLAWTGRYDERSAFQRQVQRDLTEHSAVRCPTPAFATGRATFDADQYHAEQFPDGEAPDVINQDLGWPVPPTRAAAAAESVAFRPLHDAGPVLPANAMLYEKPAGFSSERTRLPDFFVRSPMPGTRACVQDWSTPSA